MASSQEAKRHPAHKKKKKSELEDPVRFDDVLKRELERLNKSREKRHVSPPAHEDNLIGLAFSGGGIRSATFNLGLLQALAQKGLLSKFDYLSTVSGGGYIGSWLTAFTKRYTDPKKDVWAENEFSGIEKALSPARYDFEQRSEPPVVHWLRLYSNYLTPHTGLISGDTWAMLGTWLRNSFLNQTIFGMIFVALLVLCQSILLKLIEKTYGHGVGMLWAGAIVLAIACILMAVDIVDDSREPKIRVTWFQRAKITITVMLPFVVACVLLNAGLWERTDLGDQPLMYWAGGGLLFYLVVWGFVAILGQFRRKRHSRKGKPVPEQISLRALIVFSPLAGAAGGSLFKAYMLLLRNLPDWASTDLVVLVFGSGALMSIMLLVGTLHIGLVGRGSMDVVREWWARLGGYLSLITMGWLLLATTTVFAPLGVRWVFFELRRKSIIVAVLWIVHNFLGLKAAGSPKTSGKINDPNVKKVVAMESQSDSGSGSRIKNALTSPAVLSALAKAAPYVFLLGLVLIVSTGVQIATGLFFDFRDATTLWQFNNGQDWPSLQDAYWNVLTGQPAGGLLIIAVIFFIAGFLLSWRVDVNDFSLHHFYRNRLVRCYLGASNAERNPEPFTGFDADDDLPLCSLDDNYPGPYPIINAALNITGGEELGYATRRAKSFAFTPLYCGYELGAPGEHELRFSRSDGYEASYCRTEQGRTRASFGKLPCDCGITLGTAMAISGAAASPNMGYHTNPATAFYMALFDVRLGWWMGNSRKKENWASTGPELGFMYLFAELFAQSDQKKSYVYLSDGGHFENLAVYELIRRRCRLIVAGDGDADGGYGFSDLLSLIEKARTDFGVRIEIDFATIRPASGSRECPKNFAIGKIYYDPENRNDVGTLILVKSSMPMRGAVPTNPSDRRLADDVWRYYEQHETFPHQTTADQWFNECQFESYRALGEYIGCQASRYISNAVREALEFPRLAWRAEI
jgi:hypothetical protein